MFWSNWLKSFGQRRPPICNETDSVRRIAEGIEQVAPERARYLAGYAYVLSRAARADLSVTPAETERMVGIMQRESNLAIEQAARIVEHAKEQNRLYGSTEDFLATREFRDISTRDQRRNLLECLFVVCAGDGSLSSVQEGQIRQIASELGFAHHHYVAIRMGWSHEQDALRGVWVMPPQ